MPPSTGSRIASLIASSVWASSRGPGRPAEREQQGIRFRLLWNTEGRRCRRAPQYRTQAGRSGQYAQGPRGQGPPCIAEVRTFRPSDRSVSAWSGPAGPHAVRDPGPWPRTVRRRPRTWPFDLPDRDPDLATDPRSCAMIIFTSGSEGKPKGVMLSHANVGGQHSVHRRIPRP
ncbi:MAG: AMP-binding protein [Anaerotruncus sp.]|nr:AMP-binding protein [Anaerotruncus sp.]